MAIIGVLCLLAAVVCVACTMVNRRQKQKAVSGTIAADRDLRRR